MRILFLQARAVDESLALCDVAGELAARGHTLRLLLTAHERDWLRTARRWSPDLVVIQAAFMAEPWIRESCHALAGGPPTVLVGTAATFGDELLGRTEATWALQGEIDDTLPELVRRIEAGQDVATVPGLVRREEGVLRKTAWGLLPDGLDLRPMPLRSLYFESYPALGRFPWKRFGTGRGCVHSCGFCYLPPMREGYGGLRPNVRRKCVQRVIDEVRAVRSRWPVERIHFADDLFAPSRVWLEELAERWPREVGIPFTANTSPESVTEANARLLARAGARIIGIGLETGREEHRTGILGRGTRDEAIRRAASRLRAEGIELLTFNMLANPGENFDGALSTVRLNQEIGATFARVNLAYPAPGSRLEDLLRDAGRELPAPDQSTRDQWRAWCADGDPTPYEALVRVFRLALRWKLPEPVLRTVGRVPDARLLTPFMLYDAFVEARWSGVSAAQMLRYGLFAGLPTKRVTYHESFL
jgi:radical SAM superfamily enzyme YgiQ (UPF0313 family)